MSYSRGQVKFNDSIKHFKFNKSEGICKPKLYNTLDEMLDNISYDNSEDSNNVPCDKRPWFKRILVRYKGNSKKIDICNHNEELVEIYTEYGGGFYWNGTACRKCNMIVKNLEPFELPVERACIDGAPAWVQDYSKYYND